MAQRQGMGQEGWQEMRQERAARGLVWLLVVAIALSAAYWTWRIFLVLAPAPQATASSAPGVAHSVSQSGGQHWFAAKTEAVVSTGGRYVLRWVYPGRPGVCILAMPGLQDRTFRVGDEVEAGLVLREVGADYVILEGSGGAERIQLPPKSPPLIANASPAPPG